MENEMENIKSIMQPFFDKEEEIKNIRESVQDLIEYNSVELRLKRLRENKEHEITEYLQNLTSNNSGYPDGYYKDKIKRDLEQTYKAEEDKLEAQLKEIDKSYSNKPDYSNVYAHEMSDLKSELRKKLFSKQRELNEQLMQQQRALDEINLKIKYLYSGSQNPNQNDWKKMYDESDLITSKIREIQDSLKFIDENLKLTEYTESLRPMTPWEKAEYDRRNKSIDQEQPKINSDEKTENIKSFGEVAKTPTELEMEESQKLNDELNKPILEKKDEEAITPPADFIIEEPESKNYFEGVAKTPAELEMGESKSFGDDFKLFEPTQYEDIFSTTPKDLEETFLDKDVIPPVINNDRDVELENTRDVIKMIYTDIVDGMDMNYVKLNSSKGKLDSQKRYLSTKTADESNYHTDGVVDLGKESIELPNGVFFNKDDMKKALKNYRKKSKGKSYIVSAINSKLKVTRDVVRKIKDALKECATVELLKEDKLGKMDIARVYGKERANDLQAKAEEQELGTVTTPVPEGVYGNREDFITNLSSILEEKTPSWIDRIRNHFSKNKIDDEMEETNDVFLDPDISEFIKKR